MYSISLVVYFLAPPVRIEDSDKAEEFNRCSWCGKFVVRLQYHAHSIW